ncbi:hypothetical protein [Nitrosopumilus sp.]|uniref:hypothetical protein n=1 Tax=Nitrosopumilus sp. TaxID=2024843 RepID=UPI0029310CA2|nr:hypothetical protein [Nitrosopumilus sp.]
MFFERENDTYFVTYKNRNVDLNILSEKIIEFFKSEKYTTTQNYINPLTGQNNPLTREISDVFQVSYEIDIVDSVLADKGDDDSVTISFLISSSIDIIQ